MKLLPATILTLCLSACATSSPNNSASPASASPAPATVANDPVKFPPVATNLLIHDEAVGQGRGAENGQAATIDYTGWLYDPSKPNGRGKKFDSSRDSGLPFTFLIGAGKVIRGWDEGVIGMKIGGRRTLIIPANMAYGSRQLGDLIPANSTLIFDLYMVNVFGNGGNNSIPPLPPKQ